jgi:hypothetical protein
LKFSGGFAHGSSFTSTDRGRHLSAEAEVERSKKISYGFNAGTAIQM